MLYFAYGANTNILNMARRCPNAKRIKTITLYDFELAFNGVATIRAKDGSQASGVVWDITDACERALDAFEGFPSLYRKEFVWSNDLGEYVMVYILNEDSEVNRMPTMNYYKCLYEGYKENKIPTGQLLDALEACEYA